MQRKLIANIWKSPTGEILQSKHRHDFVSDSEGNFIDGGLSYIRMGGNSMSHHGWQDLCVYSDDPHEEQREAFQWHHRGGWMTPAQMSTDYIEAVLETQHQIPEHIRELFENELRFRKEL